MSLDTVERHKGNMIVSARNKSKAGFINGLFDKEAMMTLSKLRLTLISFFVSAVCCCGALSAAEIYVDGNNPYASDNNAGTNARPLKTISKAAYLADKNNKNNIQTTVIVNPGTYRESIALPFVSDHSNTEAAIIFKASSPGSVIISGSDIWTGWKKESSYNIYSRNWPYNWGAVPQPWPNDENLAEIVRRREIVFVGGKIMKQVLSYKELLANSFYVSESQDKIYVRMPAGVDINNYRVEVAVRSKLFTVDSRKNVTIRGFVFQHANTAVDGNAVDINNSSNILVEDNSFIWNNWGGLRFNSSNNITARGNVANHNGGRGMEAWRIKNLLFEENTTSFNNWRGVRGNFTGFAVAGLKHLRIHDGTYRRHVSVGNKTRGFWCDFDCSDVTVEDAILTNNLKDGIFVEASEGPVTIQDSAICNNEEGPGIIGDNSQYVTLDGNVFYGNGDSQIAVRGVNTGRTVDNWETGKKMNLYTRNWTVVYNVIMGKKGAQSLIDVKESPADRFISSLTSNKNIWYNAFNLAVFKADGTFDFTKWKSVTGQDSGSVFRDPSVVSMSAEQKGLLNLCKSETIITELSIRSESVTHDSALITWSTAEPGDSQVEYGTDESYGKMSKHDPEPDVNHLVLITGLKPETTYHYRVVSQGDSGDTVVSGDRTFTTQKFTDTHPPSTPSVLTAIVISGSQVNLSWGPSTDNVGVYGYRIYRNGTPIKVVRNTHYSDTDLDPSTKYTYTVSSIDEAGNESAESKESSAFTYAGSSDSSLHGGGAL
ncbi:MAG: right-handed parallel beta-helix repeat-containing protein [Thermodesulfobacteriota bacterium]